MTRDNSEDSLREASWRRPLTTAEADELRKQLAGNRDAKADWEAELALTEALRSLPNVPLASNFTARVVDAALRDSADAKRKGSWISLSQWRLRRLLPRLVFALAVGAVGFFSFHQLHEAEIERIGRSARVVSEVASVPGLDALSDFEAIRVMDAAPAADEELLRLMQ